MDWNDLKIALAVARHGSLSAAARALGTTQPTVSRRLAGFERKTGVKLFERGKDGLTPTQLGAALTDGLDLMDEGALAVERRIASRDTGLQGPITVTSLDWLGDYIIVPIAARFGASILSSRSNCSTTRASSISPRGMLTSPSASALSSRKTWS
jgi:DNA-binding transcriptional LysR family regulator